MAGKKDSDSEQLRTVLLVVGFWILVFIGFAIWCNTRDVAESEPLTREEIKEEVEYLHGTDYHRGY